MPKYLLLYRSLMSAGDQMAANSPEEAEAEMAAWNAWGAKAGAAIVDFGAPTMPTSQDDPGPAGHIGGFSILQADDLDALNAVLDGHPHAAHGTIEIHQMIDLPGM